VEREKALAVADERLRHWMARSMRLRHGFNLDCLIILVQRRSHSASARTKPLAGTKPPTLFVFEMAPGPCAYKRNFFSDRLGILSGMIACSRLGAGEAFLITAGIAAQTHGRA
jgi:hypothetical protein